MKQCILAGVGGQGTVLASKLLAQAAINQGFAVHTAETIGMAQRGGCVASHVRIGTNMHSPLIPHGSADVLVGFELAEAARNAVFVRPGGIMIVNSKAIQPFGAVQSGKPYSVDEAAKCLRAIRGRLILIDGESLCAELGTAKALNVLLMGAAIATDALGIGREAFTQAIAQMLPSRLQPLNLRAFQLGFDQLTKGESAI